MMKFVILLVLLSAAMLGVGLYRGWFRFGSERTVDTSKVTITVDTEKIHQDKDKAVGKAQGIEHQAEAEAVATVSKVKAPATRPATQP
jgi:hypothetical protein